MGSLGWVFSRLRLACRSAAAVVVSAAAATAMGPPTEPCSAGQRRTAAVLARRRGMADRWWARWRAGATTQHTGDCEKGRSVLALIAGETRFAGCLSFLGERARAISCCSYDCVCRSQACVVTNKSLEASAREHHVFLVLPPPFRQQVAVSFHARTNNQQLCFSPARTAMQAPTASAVSCSTSRPRPRGAARAWQQEHTHTR